MEIWHEHSVEQKNSKRKTTGGYLPEFCEALIRLHQQRKSSSEINRLVGQCQTLQHKIDRRKRKLLVDI